MELVVRITCVCLKQKVMFLIVLHIGHLRWFYVLNLFWSMKQSFGDSGVHSRCVVGVLQILI